MVFGAGFELKFPDTEVYGWIHEVQRHTTGADFEGFKIRAE